ncbi:MAG: M36 family metallopeptidase [Polyangia bacterium]
MKRGLTSRLPAGRRTLARLTLGAWGLWGAAASLSLSLGAGCSDGRGTQGLSPAAPAQAAADGERVLPVSAYVVHRDTAAGLPNLAWLEAKRPVAPGTPAAEVAWATLRGLPAAYKLDAAALRSASLVSVHDTGNGPLIASFTQKVEDRDVFGSRMAITLDRHSQPQLASGHLVPAVRPLSTQFVLDEAEAAAAALRGLTAVTVERTENKGREAGGYTALTLVGSTGGVVLNAPARAKQVFFPSRAGLIPAYYVELDVSRSDGQDARMYSLVIDATDGRVLFQNDLTASDSFTYRVYADDSGAFLPFDGPQGTAYTPHPTGNRDKSAPANVPAKLVKLQNAPFSKNDPWLDAGATEAKGNNVWAYADIAAPDGYGMGDVNLPTSAAGTFDYTVDPDTDASKSNEAIHAVTTQLFYTLNFMHDFFYDPGWNEAAYNPQAKNFGRGGTEGDAIKAEAQDNSGRNNANASTPADGRSPRIQMYLFDNSSSQSQITAPMELAADLDSGGASFGPGTFSLTGDLVLVDDGVVSTMMGGAVTDGCETPFKNAAALAGKIAVVDRGACNFVLKVKNAQTQGAAAVVVVNNVAGAGAMGMTGTDATVTIPSVGISKEDGDKIKAKLAAGSTVSVTLKVQKYVRDGSLDTTIVSHEWGHVLSNRLIGNGNGLTNLQGRGMGEGWSDFVALLTITRPEDAMAPSNAGWNGVFPVGTHALAAPGNYAYYDGIRRYPYSADLKKNPLTYRMIEDGVALPMTPKPAFGADGSDNSEVHNTGEVWSAMLFECYTGLLRDTARFTFEQANRRMRDILVASLKITPAAPTVLEARDAVLAAARTIDPRDFQICWDGFAKRGAGMGAKGPDRGTAGNKGVSESYMVGGDVEIAEIKLDQSSTDCDHDDVLDPGESGKLTITLRNIGAKDLADTTVQVSSNNPAVTIKSGSAKAAKLEPYKTTQLTFELAMARDAKPLTAFDLKIDVTDPALMAGRVVTQTYQGLGSYDDVAASSATEGFDARTSDWTPSSDSRLDDSQPWERRFTRGNGVWHGFDIDGPADNTVVSPAIQLGSVGPFGLTIKHRYDFEKDGAQNFDGGIIEVSDDEGKSWIDVGAFITQGGYNGKLEKSTSNPLSERQAFTGRSTGYLDGDKPGYTSTVLTLSDAYKAKTVRLRFRIGSDDAAGAEGWDVDEIAWTGLRGTPFSARREHRGKCVGSALTVSAMAAPMAAPGTSVQLTATAMGGDGEVSFEWTQTAGPSVQLTGAVTASASFVAPEVTEPTKLVFQVVARDRLAQSDPAVVEIQVGSAADKDGGCSFVGATGATSSAGSLLGLALAGSALVIRRRRRR